MDSILKDTTGKIWMNDGSIIKNTPYNTPVIQEGLSFWGSTDPTYLTIVDNLVSEAYDIRNTGQKMTQATVGSRPALVAGYNGFTGLTTNTKALTKPVLQKDLKDMFVVISNRTFAGEGIGLGLLETSPSGLIRLYGSTSNNTAQYRSTEVSFSRTAQTCYVDSTLINGYTTVTVNKLYVVLHTKNAYNSQSGFLNNVTLAIGGLWAVSSSTSYIVEWGWYNRNLKTAEIIYNVNALNQKYNYV